MKQILLALVGSVLLLFVGCAAHRPTDDINNHVLKADKKWAEFNAYKMPKSFAAGIVARERRMYVKIMDRKDLPRWRVRRAGWNYVIAVNEAMVPEIKQPPGRFTVQPNPFM